MTTNELKHLEIRNPNPNPNPNPSITEDEMRASANKLKTEQKISFFGQNQKWND